MSLKLALNKIEEKTIQAEIDRENLENILLSKGSDIARGLKITQLIENVNDLNVYNNLPNWAEMKNIWLSASNLTSVRYGSISESIDDKIYVIGGYNRAIRTLNLNECYDSTNNTWDIKTNLPKDLRDMCSGRIGSKIYVITGKSDSVYDFFNTNYCYDTLTDTWTSKSNAITATMNASSDVVNDKIYVMGGREAPNTGAYIVKNQCYDALTDTWSTKSNMLSARSKMAMSSINGKIYVIGDDSSSGDKNHCYDTLTDTWSTKSNFDKVSTKDFKGISHAFDGKIYLLGYISHSKINNTVVRVYDPKTDSYDTINSMPFNTQYFSSSIIGNKIFCFGGRYDDPVTVDDKEFDYNNCYII